jgi:protein-S-isoprenylcysteine O-methyltransferase Ste14
MAVAQIAAILLKDNIIDDKYGLSTFVGAYHADHFYLTKASIAALVIMLLSTWLRIVCYKTMSRHFTFEISFREKHKLVTQGPYSYVRHPSYSGMTLVYIALFLWHLSPGSWVMESGILHSVPGLTYILAFAVFMIGLEVAVLLRIEKEDAMLRKNFGKEWEDWAKRTPYAIIPGIW